MEEVRGLTRYGEVPIRLYLPQDTGRSPLIIFYHGGGFVLGDIQSYDHLASAIAEASSCVVALVVYQLAPKAKSPALIEESYEALTWLSGQDPNRWDFNPNAVGVAGDSAGGSLAAVIAQVVRQRRDRAKMGSFVQKRWNLKGLGCND